MVPSKVGLLGMAIVALVVPAVAGPTSIAAAAQGRSVPASPVLYRSRVRCGECYWELAFAGQPGNPNQLALTGALLTAPWISHDAGRSWSAATLTGVTYPFTGDPQLLVTSEGELLLSALTPFDHPAGGPLVLGGALYRGPIAGSIFTGTPFKEPPPDLPSNVFLVADFPKLARDAASDTVYISSNATFFSDETIGYALFVSPDGGGTFSEQRLTYSGSAVMSMDTTPEGALRAVVVQDFGNSSREIHMLRFDATASTFTLASPIMAGLPSISARVSATGARGWIVDPLPKIAVDRTPGGVHAGRIYVSWAQPQTLMVDPAVVLQIYGSDYDVFLAYSDDDGDSWSFPVRVNDDATTGDQVFQSMRLDAAGDVHIAFLDRRESPGRDRFDVYYTVVRDGVVAPNVRVNAAHVRLPHGGRVIHPTRLIGDYLNMVVAYTDVAYVAHPCSSGRDICLTALDPRLMHP